MTDDDLTVCVECDAAYDATDAAACDTNRLCLVCSAGCWCWACRDVQRMAEEDRLADEEREWWEATAP